jgi:hypothetical protein
MWFEEKATTIAESAQNCRSIEIKSNNDMNKKLGYLFKIPLPKLERLAVPINCLQNESLLMLIKGLESMPQLRELDISFAINS